MADAAALLTVTFDRPLQPGASAIGNWTGVRFSLGAFRAFDPSVPLTILGNTVSGIVITQPAPVAGPDRISYAAAPADVIGTNGAPVLPFVDFPLAILP